MAYVGRYDNGTGYMEFAASPVRTVQAAQAQTDSCRWSSSIDVAEVRYDGQQWQIIREGVAYDFTCGYCNERQTQQQTFEGCVYCGGV